MHFLTPKFVLVAMLASLTAFSLAPPADAAAIAMRRGNQQHISDSSGTRSGSSASHLSHPVLPLPARLTSASGKQTKDDSDTSSRGSMKRQSPRDFFASQRRSLTPEDLPPLLTRRDPSHQASHQLHNIPPDAPAQQSTQKGSEPEPYVHVKGLNSHVAFDRRAPYPRHRHEHHHHGNHHDHHGSKHADDVVVIEGDNDNVHISGRSTLPDPPHHHDHHRRTVGATEMIPAKDDKALGRRSPNPRHDHHHHHHQHGNEHHKGHGGEKVVIKGDDNNVSVHSRSRTARQQHDDHSPEFSEKGSHREHQHRVHARTYISGHQPHYHDGESSTDRVEYAESPQHGGQDQTEKRPRSVLINSVEGEAKYLVPDDYQDQSVTVIEGDGISKIISKTKRGDPGLEGVPGSIEIMSQSAMLEAGQRIASLVLVEPDSTTSEFGNNTFILNASENNQTQLYMVALNTSDSGVEGEDVPVALKVPVFNPSSASMEGYCATYDPQPPAPAPLSVERCFYDEPTGPHKSQVFAYTPSTSVIRPMWFSNETDEEDSLYDSGTNSTVDPKTPLNGDITRVTDVGDFGNSTAPPPSIASLNGSTGIDEELSKTGSGNDSMIPNIDDFAAKAQNVTLVFSPATLIVPSSSRTPTDENPSGLDKEMPMSGTNGTDTDALASPLKFNNTETDWTGSLDDGDLPAASMPLPYSVASGTVSPVAVPSGSVAASDDGKDLNVMVGVARENGVDSSSMKAVDTAPYKWRFDRDRS